MPSSPRAFCTTRTISSTSPWGSSTWAPKSPASSPKRTSRGRMAAQPSGATADPLPRRRQRRRPEAFFEQTLARYRMLTTRALLDFIPRGGPPYLYELVSAYPRRGGKGLRAALCLATCGALGGSEQQSLNSAVAIELFHNAFLLHDDVQDGSLARRGGATLYR